MKSWGIDESPGMKKSIVSCFYLLMCWYFLLFPKDILLDLKMRMLSYIFRSSKRTLMLPSPSHSLIICSHFRAFSKTLGSCFYCWKTLTGVNHIQWSIWCLFLTPPQQKFSFKNSGPKIPRVQIHHVLYILYII